MSMMPLRVAMPKSVMKPTSEAIDNVPPEIEDHDNAANQRKRKVRHYEKGGTHRLQRDVKQ